MKNILSSSLFKRTISAIFLIGISLTALVAGYPWAHLLAGAVALALSYEWMGLFKFEKQKVAFLFYGTILGLLGASFFLSLSVVLALCLIGATFFYYMISRSKPLESHKKALWFFWGVLYIAFPILIFLWILEKELGLFLILWLLLIIWTNDTAAYFIGSWVKGPKLAPSISPKKTWSGFIGGCMASALVGGAIASIFSLEAFLPYTGLGFCVAFLGSLGDLLESALKRYAGVKDASNLIPGHGGFLDRLDSILFVLPFYGLYIGLVG